MDTGWHIEAGDGGVELVIGMRWPALWRLASRPWVARSFMAMCAADSSSGLERMRLGVHTRGPVVVQRWRSRAELASWARDPDHVHAPAWARFRRTATGTSAWGIWHELRPVPA